MNNSEILQKVARRELTPEEATTVMLANDDERHDDLRAGWIERLATIIAIILIGVFVWDCLHDVSHGQAPRWTQSDGLLAAQACVHEADFDSLGDCGGILQVVESRRRPGETFSAALRRTMPRFTAGRTERAWALRLPFGPITRNPEGWPYPVSARHRSASWTAVVDRVRAHMREGLALPCTPEPSSWMGPGPDGHVIAERLASGRWGMSACGETRNVFLYQTDPE